MSLIKCQGLSKSYAHTKVVNEVSLELLEGQSVVIQGASGSGKSTLLYLMGGLEKPDSGLIEVAGKNLSALDDEALSDYRNQVLGFIFQFHYLLPSFSALDNILLPARLSKSADVNAVTKMVTELAVHLGVSDSLGKYPYELSGGQQQRVNLLRAVSLRPKILLCDEPTGNLDSHNAGLVIELLLNIAKTLKTTLVVVTHDHDIASRFAKKFVMRDGKLSS